MTNYLLALTDIDAFFANHPEPSLWTVITEAGPQDIIIHNGEVVSSAALWEVVGMPVRDLFKYLTKNGWSIWTKNEEHAIHIQGQALTL